MQFMSIELNALIGFLFIHLDGYNICVIIQDKMSIYVPFGKCSIVNELSHKKLI